MTELAEESQRRKWVTLLLVVLPAWLAISGGVAIWYYFQREKSEARAQLEAFSRTVSADAIRDDLAKFIQVIGERHGSSENAAANLTRAASMIDGSLGPSNTGFTVSRLPGPADWPLLYVTIPGTSPDAPALWVVAGYDSRPGSPGAEANATGVVATLAAAQALAGEKPAMNLHFAFLPHANDPEAPILETAGKFAKLAGNQASILCVEAMGAGEELWLTSRDTDAMPLSKATGIGSIRGAEVVCLGDDVDLASVLFEMGLPSVRVSTRAMIPADDPDNQLPDPAAVAASSGRLIELIRRCAGTR